MTDSQFQENLTRLELFHPRSEEDMFTDYSFLHAEVGVSDEPVAWEDRLKLKYRPVAEGESWGVDWQSGWFHLTGQVPGSWRGEVVLRLNLGGEALVFDDKGAPVCGLTNASVYHPDYYKEVFFFEKAVKAGGRIDMWVEAAANNVLGPAQFNWYPHATREPYPAGHSVGTVRYMRIALFNGELRRFRNEFLQLWHYVEYLKRDVKNYRCRQIAKALSDALDVYCGNPENAAAARRVLAPILSQKALSSALKCTAIGHAHIDVGWLWPVRESIRKAGRTFSSQLRLMKRYPGYVFGASQPQLYQFVKDAYPALYKRIKAAVKAGTWECQGGMWVEADNNLPSGESLIRQFIHGKNFFKEEFGVDVKNLWLPDVFGYNGNTPQIMKICGCDFFLTQKLSWNTVNKPPYNTFRWIGIDGSEVTTHFPPENNYNSLLTTWGLAVAQDRYNEAAVCGEFLSLYGMGDGGGGPQEDLVERGRLVADWEGSPKVEFGFAQPAFDRMMACKSVLPTWHGELYFENHRGTLTTQARTKKNNRKLEQRLLQAEFINSLLPASKYPRKELDRVCKLLLLNQFHDIIPGSSIRLVYDRTEREHAEGLKALEALIQKAGSQLLAKDSSSVTFMNTLSVDYTRPLELPAAWAKGRVVGEDGAEIPVQVESDGRVFGRASVPADGFLTLRHVGGKGGAVKAKRMKGLVLENANLRFAFDKSARMTSAVVKATGQETLSAPGNDFLMFNDMTSTYDAWNIDQWYRGERTSDRAYSVAEVLCEEGPVRSVLHFRLRIHDSLIDQEVSLGADASAVEFKTAVEWKEIHKMLRVAFPTQIESLEAAYDIQYGMIRRPTHTNTSWEQVQFEVCAHRYADLSDDERGAAILNDCKYAHSVRDGVMELNLLRSSKWPDYNADQGHQEFTYAFAPHRGTLVDSSVQSDAAQLNREPWRFDGYAAKALSLPISVEGQGVSIEAVKRAERSDDLIVRVVETRGRHASATVRLSKGCGFKRVSFTNAIEWTDDGDLSLKDGEGSLALHPFQIVTLRLS